MQKSTPASHFRADRVLQSWLGYLDAVIDGQIIAAAITVLPGLPGGLKSSPVSTSRCMNTGIINFTATGSPNRWGFAIPAISSSGMVQSGGKLIITGGSPINNLYTFLLATSTTLEWSNSSAHAPGHLLRKLS